MTRATRHPVSRIARRDGAVASGRRLVPDEVPVAFSFNGTTHAVMMASPGDLEDFAVGFAITEGIVASPADIAGMAIEDHGEGIDIQVALKDEANGAFQARRRRMAGPVGCGLCGIESIEEALRPVAGVGAISVTLDAGDIARATRLLSSRQKLNAETHAVHGAGFFVRGKGIVVAREDVGRHNALDKLAGALAREGVDGRAGTVVITSRVSVEMVQKTAAIGASVLLAISAPTALAVRTAEAAGMTLVALVRGDDFEIFTCPDRIRTGAAADVA
ncbi:MAG: formate dehydrogenase accessory sulfurtransferase FdhD [Hyphomicrobiales bacterium]|nr:formate dehydrogenase accessory sulfurtransferase FdhD [Hyphomicrobiales bacterium]